MHAFGDDALGDHDAVALAEQVANGKVSPGELVEAALARAEAVNPRLNAVSLLDADGARARAAGSPTGVLAGVPTFIKGLASVAGLPNRFGSRAMPDTPAEANSPTVDQIESTGLLPVGLSTTPEFGLTATTEPALTGITRNPWNPNHSTGGSSGGSAALVAAGVVPIAHANDGGGSIRIPAASCGLVGLKPSRGRVDKEPDPKLMPVDFTIDGVVTRTVRDTAAFLYGAEQYRPVPRLAPVGHVTNPLDRPLRVGVIEERVDGVRFDSANRAAVADAATTMEELGHHVELIPNPFPAHFAADFILLWSMVPFAMWHAGARVMGEGWDRDQLEPWSKWLVRHFRRNAARAPTAFRRLRKFATEGYSASLQDHDVLLSSTLASPVPEVGYLDPTMDGDVLYERLLNHVAITPIQNVGGGPAISLPLAQDGGGLPLGIQFAADIGQEALLLALALQLEESEPWPTLASN